VSEIAKNPRAQYAIRIPANENLERDIAELLTRPVGQPGGVQPSGVGRAY
jgi:hypothetical protein